MSVAFLAFASLKCCRLLSLLSLSFTIVARIVGLPRLPTANVRKHCQPKKDTGVVAAAKLFTPSATEPTMAFMLSTGLSVFYIFKFTDYLECPELQTILLGNDES